MTQSQIMKINRLNKKIRHLNKVINETIDENIQLEHKIAILNEDIFDIKSSYEKKIRKLQSRINELQDISNLEKVIEELKSKKKEEELLKEEELVAEYDKKYEKCNAWSLDRLGVFDDGQWILFREN